MAKEKKKSKIGWLIALLLLAAVGLSAKPVTEKFIIPEYNYREVNKLMAAGEYEIALYNYELMPGYRDSDDRAAECRYQIALMQKEQGSYAEALETFYAMDGYKDCAEMAAKCELGLLRIAKPGSYVNYGSYEQDDNAANGAEEIQWLVLDNTSDRILVTSRYGLDVLPYHEKYEDITWENCTLRQWLNSEFLKSAFTGDEITRIPEVTVDNSAAQGCPDWTSDGGSDTRDRVFLLSAAEAEKYLGVGIDSYENVKSRVAPTAYALRKGAYFEELYQTAAGESVAHYWLRSPGSYQFSAAIVFYDGSLNYNIAEIVSAVIRPAMWIETGE